MGKVIKGRVYREGLFVESTGSVTIRVASNVRVLCDYKTCKLASSVFPNAKTAGVYEPLQKGLTEKKHIGVLID